VVSGGKLRYYNSIEDFEQGAAPLKNKVRSFDQKRT
jgi:hypothetical protein